MSQTNGPSFPLLKVSLATDPIEARKWNWKHETRDLRLVFDNYGSSRSYQQYTYPVLGVVQGNEILERVDLSVKIRDAEDLVTRARHGGKLLKPDDIPTTALHKRMNCAIAIRYPYSETKIRRMQLKFESVQDFDRALAVLQSLGCHLRDHEGRVQTGILPDWPQSRPTSAVEPASTHPLSSATTFGIEQPQHRPVYSDHFRPASAAAQPSPSFPQLQRASTLQSSPFGDRLRPNTPLFPIQEDESLYADPVIQNISSFEPKSELDDQSRRRATAIGSHHLDVDYSTPRTQARQTATAESHGTARPATAPKLTIAQLDDDLSSMIPPRRELPFKRPGSRQSALSRDGSTSRPSSSADLPALPRPSFINPLPVESNFVPSTVATHAAAPTADQHSTLVTLSSSSSAAARPASANNGAPASREGTGSCQLVGTKIAAATSRPLSKNAAASTGTQGRKARSTATPRAKAGSSRPSTALSSSSHSSKQQNAMPAVSDVVLAPQPLVDDLRSALDHVGSSMSAATKPQGLEQENLAEYAAMPYEQRMAALEQLIVDGVSDENFVTLCEDVYGCWQRIGFGR